MSRDPIENADQPPEVDVHDDSKKFPPAQSAATRILEFVSWFGDGEVIGEVFEQDNPPLYARDLEAAAKAAVAPTPEVLSFINQRSEYVTAARNSGGDVADYHRWQGHMEARRQLAEKLGYTVPYEVSDRTERILPTLAELANAPEQEIADDMVRNDHQ
ncbi:hypothetical protein SAMN04487912_102394 [Arthrobacter sp. cf158]|uniref:hypothetical protein n=1 Tax=Arthrobacter sp. cf158 TaxID=1761744 RepID=UPI00089827BB|nr:hypothetical protein [Arthrobacter sp. cf158]SDW34151.1 hypothetical protein SAMN04487912_102394 [Arthrobacter sp. cf158]